MSEQRDLILDLFEIRRAELLAEARSIAQQLYLQRGQPISIDDVRDHLRLPDHVDPRVLGAVFRRPKWRAVGFKNSRRRECHGRPIRTFILSDNGRNP